MNISPTTQPAPPLGITTTPTPFSVEGAISDDPIPANLAPEVISILSKDNLIYLDSFEITNQQSIGDRIYMHNLNYPLGETTSSNGYFSQPSNNLGTFRPLVPWKLMTVWFSRQCKITYQLVFEPIKVSDCRVSIDTFFTYDGQNITDYNKDTFVLDTVEKILDDSDDPFQFEVPAFYLTNIVNTYNTRIKNEYVQPAFIPKTKSFLFIRSPYVPNLMQPDTFKVMVYLRVNVSHATTIAGTGRINRTSPEADNFLPLPFVFNVANVL
jgi:hypothetical protein